MISQKEIPNKSELYDQYSHYFSGLVSLGYVARFGQNTFSVDDSDYGVSSYLRSRMLMGVPYKGFGISAQSMSPNGISYNIGKATNMTRRALSELSFKEEFTYSLPPKELAAKYIAIAAYNGSFSLPRVSELLGIDAWEYYKEEFEYCIDLGLLNIENGRAFITELGFKHYGAVFSLFYAKNDR
jgi:oxygen-independent coproporphyrinogen-3 oxidase